MRGRKRQERHQNRKLMIKRQSERREIGNCNKKCVSRLPASREHFFLSLFIYQPFISAFSTNRSFVHVKICVYGVFASLLKVFNSSLHGLRFVANKNRWNTQLYYLWKGLSSRLHMINFLSAEWINTNSSLFVFHVNRASHMKNLIMDRKILIVHQNCF